MWQQKLTTKLENSDFKNDRRKKNNTPLKNSNHIIPRNYNNNPRSKAKKPVKKPTKQHQTTEKKNSNHRGNYDKNKIAEPSTKIPANMLKKNVHCKHIDR